MLSDCAWCKVAAFAEWIGTITITDGGALSGLEEKRGRIPDPIEQREDGWIECWKNEREREWNDWVSWGVESFVTRPLYVVGTSVPWLALKCMSTCTQPPCLCDKLPPNYCFHLVLIWNSTHLSSCQNPSIKNQLDPRCVKLNTPEKHEHSF